MNTLDHWLSQARVATLGARRVRYGFAGDPARPPLLLIMGFGMPGLAWRDQLEALESSFHMVWFDNRGTGGSSLPRADLSMQTLADDACELLDHLGWSSAHIAGVSMGGMIAQQLAITHLERVRSLALIATHAGGGLPHTFPDRSALQSFVRANLSKGDTRLRALAQLLHPGDWLDQKRDLSSDLGQLLSAPAPRKTALAQLRAIHHHDTRDKLSQLAHLPVTVIVPEDDDLVPARLGLELASLIPHAHLAVLPGAKHGAPAHAADRVAALIRQNALG